MDEVKRGGEVGEQVVSDAEDPHVLVVIVLQAGHTLLELFVIASLHPFAPDLEQMFDKQCFKQNKTNTQNQEIPACCELLEAIAAPSLSTSPITAM